MIGVSHFVGLTMTRGLLAVAALILIAAQPSTAGIILLTGDANIGNPINNEGSIPGIVVPLDSGNATFFGNILGGGTSVLIQNGAAGAFGSAANAIDTYYDGLAGVTSTLDNTEPFLTDALLGGGDLFISLLPRDSYSASEISALSNFLNASGSVLFIGDNQIFSGFNARINAALSDLGSSMSLGGSSFGNGFIQTTNIHADPFTAGVNTFTYSSATEVSGGTSLIGYPNSSRSFVAYETSVQAVPEPTSLAIFGIGVLGTVGRVRRRLKRS